MNATTISMYKSYLSKKVLEVFKSYHHYVDIKENLQQGDVQQKINEYEIKEDGLLMHKN